MNELLPSSLLYLPVDLVEILEHSKGSNRVVLSSRAFCPPIECAGYRRNAIYLVAFVRRPMVYRASMS